MIYLVLDNRYGPPPVWTDMCKAFLERNDAIKYRYELMMREEIRGMLTIPTIPDLSKGPDETGEFIIKEIWLEWNHSKT